MKMRSVCGVRRVCVMRGGVRCMCVCVCRDIHIIIMTCFMF